MADGHAWWQRGVVYQVYPRSFQDSDGDGVGDLPGLLARLDHLVDLGVDAVWVSPVYPSPMADFGYDVADHVGIDPVFGTLGDMDRLIEGAHARGLRVVLDYVPNHTSDRHPWFLASRSSRGDPRRDWYVWRDPAPGGGPPSNWLSEFGGGAWTLDPGTGQYYYHAYLPEQPDLNWRNAEVRAAMLDVLRFWLARGVDGFRVDAIHHLFEDEGLRDNPPNPDWRPGMSPARSLLRARTMDLPEVQEAVASMRRTAGEFGPDRLLIGEAYLPIERLMAYYGTDLSGFHLPFNFHLMSTPWDPASVAGLVAAYEAALPPGGWPNWVLGNHDRPRVASRLGQGQARVAAMLLLTLRGTPTLYQGDEIGMEDVPIPPELVRDPWERNVPGLGLGRDPVRVPIPWDAGPGAGFTTGRPWLPLPPDRAARNVAAQAADPRSTLALHRALLRLRRSEPALSVGDHAPVLAEGDVLAYERRAPGGRFLVALNMGGRPREPAGLPAGGRVLASTHMDRAGEATGDAVRLRADEGLVIGLPPA
jgi:alpha-glucosidase